MVFGLVDEREGFLLLLQSISYPSSVKKNVFLQSLEPPAPSYGTRSAVSFALHTQLWLLVWRESQNDELNCVWENIHSPAVDLEPIYIYIYWSEWSSYQLGSFFFSAVFADISGPHRWSLVVSNEGQHHHQRLHRPNSEGVERGDGGLYPHTVRPYLNCALHAPPWEKVR